MNSITNAKSYINTYNVLQIAQRTEAKVKQLEKALNTMNSRITVLNHVEGSKTQKQISSMQGNIIDLMTSKHVKMSLAQLNESINNANHHNGLNDGKLEFTDDINVEIIYDTQEPAPINNDQLKELNFLSSTDLKITDLTGMFKGAKTIETIDLSGWSFDSLSEDQQQNMVSDDMFKGCFGLTKLKGKRSVLYYLIHNGKSGIRDTNKLLEGPGDDEIIEITIQSLVIKAVNVVNTTEEETTPEP